MLNISQIENKINQSFYENTGMVGQLEIWLS